MRAQTGATPADLVAPDVGEAAHLAYAVFMDIARSRMSGWAPQPLQWGQLADWQRLCGLTLPPWLVEAVIAIDGVFLSQLAERGTDHADRRREDHLHR